MYGNSYIGEPAIEIQRYASNVNQTLNLLHSATGVDYFDVLTDPLSESSSINETTAALSATVILFSFSNLARDSVDALYDFAPAVMVTDLMN